MQTDKEREIRNRLKEHLAGPMPDDLRVMVEKALATKKEKPRWWHRFFKRK